jgi:methyl-accepting chemotaxis protein
MPRNGSVGKETYEQVEALVKQGKSKTEAFAQISSETGRNIGTVSANYYRVSRANGTVKPRRRRLASTRATSRTHRTGTKTVRGGTSDIDRLAADLVKSVTALADAVRSQEAEVASLRTRIEGVREAIG